MIKTALVSCLIFLVSFSAFSQQKAAYKFHSHNDYLQSAPFWTAYANGAASIEVDVILQDGQLMVAHEIETIQPERTLASLYLDPIRQAKKLGIGQLDFQLLVDIKTAAYPSMKVLKEVLEGYDDILAIPGKQTGVRVVISGNRPAVEDYDQYPPAILFDYQHTEFPENLPWQKIALVSLPFQRFSEWNGKGRLVHAEKKKLDELIAKVHAVDRPIRFWGAPDSKTAWKAFADMGIDYINTDMPFEASEYLKSLPQNVVGSSHRHNIYHPKYEVDGATVPVNQIILMIGDGNGLAHISAGMYAHGNELNLTQLRHIGLVKTQAADDFTTDSAAGATALATGHKANNRAIGFSPEGKALSNLPELLENYQFNSGILTTDHLTGATPASFYAHCEDRGMTVDIANDLRESSLDLFIGGGKNDFLLQGRDLIAPLNQAGFTIVKSLEELNDPAIGKAGYFASNQGLPTVMKGREGFLKTAAEQSLAFLGNKEQPFFLLIEGSMIDTGGHWNSAETVVEEEIDFDEAVGEVIAYADAHPGTLVLITADHETGGVTLPQGNMGNAEVELNFDTNDHTGIMVPLFAYGAHSGEFMGVYENTEIFKKIMQLVDQYHER
ncbi:alkaline phosphatase [Echinicola strongylocentroti]|uniref:Alkaline phosphatase n=1 Tax=Echinicola strongylocentroti TaxID=1795355 RepID=A0A2Z4IMY7_9BACT|nr:alkaline phosphatase [Echinicola strongylocentroti]AWW32097.1 alkaline phosphatase [Echinicola strongylocentroti]